MTDLALSVVVPAHDRVDQLRECLAAIAAATRPLGAAASRAEVIVVDDASTEDVRAVAEAAGARVLRLPANAGPAAARNLGARHARGAVLLFVDSDVVVRADTLARVAGTFADHPDVAALFGSYDDAPRAADLISQYRNLLHHYVHQRGEREASTFWAGCGAIRRAVFEEAGGFDARRYPRPSIEDIELGDRLRAAGHRIVLDPDLLVAHLKRWTLRSMVTTDLVHRAVPWARLIRERRRAPRDLNLGWPHRVSAALTVVAGVGLLVAPLHPGGLVVSAIAVAGVAAVNRDFFALLRRRRGLAAAAACLPLHLLHYACGVAGGVVAGLSARADAGAHADVRGGTGRGWRGAVAPSGRERP